MDLANDMRLGWLPLGPPSALPSSPAAPPSHSPVRRGLVPSAHPESILPEQGILLEVVV